MSFPGFERVRNQYYNINLPDLGKSVDYFAELMQYDRPTDIRLRLPERELNRHVFISGMTGSGKTNTVHHLLSVMGDFPYLVIEPVKGEYHSLPGVKSYHADRRKRQVALPESILVSARREPAISHRLPEADNFVGVRPIRRDAEYT